MSNSSAIRSFARESLSGKWLNAVLASLIYCGITSLASSTYGVVLLAISGALVFGLYLYYLNLVREKAGDFNLLFKAFSFSGKISCSYTS